MGQPFVGEIRMFAGNFAPAGWMLCQGQTLAISENETLFQLIGTTYGGDGQSTFQLPNLQGCVPIHQGTGSDGITYTMGEFTGVETVTLTTQQMPTHNHPFIAVTDIGGSSSPQGALLAQSDSLKLYSTVAPNSPLNASSMQPAGGSQPHENMQPYLCVNFIISLFGIFPTQT